MKVKLLSYAEFLAEYESASHAIHHNKSVSHLKAYTQNVPGKKVRYVVDHEGKLHFGNADHHIHMDIHKSPNGKDIQGYAHHDEDGFHHRIAYTMDRDKRETDDPRKADHEHPTIKKMEERGFKRSKKPFGFES